MDIRHTHRRDRQPTTRTQSKPYANTLEPNHVAADDSISGITGIEYEWSLLHNALVVELRVIRHYHHEIARCEKVRSHILMLVGLSMYVDVRHIRITVGDSGTRRMA